MSNFGKWIIAAGAAVGGIFFMWLAAKKEGEDNANADVAAKTNDQLSKVIDAVKETDEQVQNIPPATPANPNPAADELRADWNANE